MAATNSSIASSVLLTTLLANCQLVTVPPFAGTGAGAARNGQVGGSLEALSTDGEEAGAQGKIPVREDPPVYTRDSPPNASSSKTGGRHKSDKFDKFDNGGSGKSEHEVGEDDAADPGAVMYIIVVLVFYSTGVMVMIVRYLKTEKKELEEEVTLENFFNSMPDKRVEKEYTVNRVAIRAFHTLTSISYDDEELENMDLGSESEADFPDRKRGQDSCSQPLLVTDL